MLSRSKNLVVLTVLLVSLVVYIAATSTRDVYFMSDIQEPARYADQLQRIITAPFYSVVRIHVGGNGGQLDTVRAIANAVQLSNARIETVVYTDVYSAHALIVLLGSGINIGDQTLVMFHRPTLVDIRTNKPVTPEEICKDNAKCLAAIKANSAVGKVLYERLLKPILSRDEKNRFDQGEDIYFTGKELKRRLNRK